MENETFVIQNHNERDHQEIKRLLRAVSHDPEEDRIYLTGIYVRDGLAVAANGYILNAVTCPECLKPYEGRVLKITQTGEVSGQHGDWWEYTVQDLGDKYVKYYDLIAKQKINFQVVVNIDFLRDLLWEIGEKPSDYEKQVVISFTTHQDAIMLSTEDRIEPQHFGMAMPMHSHFMGNDALMAPGSFFLPAAPLEESEDES